MIRDMAQLVPLSQNNNMQPTSIERQPITDEYVQMWINNLDQFTNIFYNSPSEYLSQNPGEWQKAQNKLVQFQKIHDPIELCTEIIKRSRKPLVLYTATLCLKNAIANDFKKFDLDELFKLFQFLYEFLCSQALENEMSVNETTALICAMILKRIASERTRTLSAMAMVVAVRQGPPNTDKEADKITNVIKTLCSHIKEPTESLNKKIASALMLSSLLLEFQMTNRSTLLGIRVWKHMNARKLIEAHLKIITEACLETINSAFSSNLLNPVNQTPETQILFYLVGTLIRCIEYALSFNSTDTGCASSSDRVLRVIQSRTINMLSQVNEHDQRTKTLREWCELVMAPNVVQFLFTLYTTVKSMINCVPGWSWPTDVLKNCLNCLYYLSDVHNSINIERDDMYAEFVGQLMLGSVKIMDAEVHGIDDSFQIACLITSISMHTSEARDTITKIKAQHFVPFMDAAQRFTNKVFTKVATTNRRDEEEEEEKTVDALLDFWFHLLRNIDAENRWVASTNPPQAPKVTIEGKKAYARAVVESYISCHLHQPLGQLAPKTRGENDELDLDLIDEQDDSAVHAQQLVSFSMIARFDALHTAKVLIELLSTRLGHFEALLTQFIATKQCPDGIQEWEYINDDLHWLLLMLQHYLTQTGYGEIGFMCIEILTTSIEYNANVEKTLEGFEKCDYTSSEVDPIVRLMIIALKLCQIEMGICQSGNISWLSVQTNGTLTTLLSRFCLTYLYPKESDYQDISETMNYCFGQDAPTAEKFLRYVIEHSCCIILVMKSDAHVVNKNIQLLIQLLTYHPNAREIITSSDNSSMVQAFMAQMKPENLTGFSPRVAKSIIKLATRLFVEEDDWNKLIEFFTNKWAYIMTCIQTQQHKSEMVSTKFLEFCDFAVGVCEACDDEISERLFEQLLVPIVKAIPVVLEAFRDFGNVPVAVFDLLYHIVKYPMVNICTWDSDSAKTFYDECRNIIEAYARIVNDKKRSGDEEDCEDIISVLTFAYEVMKRDWGNSSASCDAVVRFAMEKLSMIIRPEYMEFPRIRTMYYRLLVYLVDEDERLATLSDSFLNVIVSSVLLALKSQFDKDVDNHTYTIIGIICRIIYLERGNIGRSGEMSERLSKFMMPVLPALFETALNQGSFTINTETAEMIAPALFSLRCCFLELYHQLVKDLIAKQDDQFSQQKIKNLFDNLESRIHKLTLNRAACREFSSLFVPFLAELHNYITTR